MGKRRIGTFVPQWEGYHPPKKPHTDVYKERDSAGALHTPKYPQVEYSYIPDPDPNQHLPSFGREYKQGLYYEWSRLHKPKDPSSLFHKKRVNDRVNRREKFTDDWKKNFKNKDFINFVTRRKKFIAARRRRPYMGLP
ncbi:hypothetical protein P9112_009938 [Eukaryota sp. TZLM1-RC]